MSLAACCSLLSGLWRMLLRPFRLQSREAQYRVPLIGDEPQKEAEPEAPQLSQDELARILGNTLPQSKAPTIRECDEKEFIEVARGSDSQAALEAVREAPAKVVNACDECSGTALHFLAAEGHVQACGALLSRDDFVEINARNGIGSTALHIAAANDEEEICKMILECPRFTAGASVANDNGQTPLDFALEFGTGLCSSVLEAAGGQGGTRRRRGRHIYGRTMVPEDDDTVQDMDELD
ncbi:unnamed protein product [Durusdinium trenchii]|uniref:Uncharacterized protein n=1 Tax=Durusdinium trenchii TaxID=1381693 RepID=A0ABP0HGE4_9DINO